MKKLKRAAKNAEEKALDPRSSPAGMVSDAEALALTDESSWHDEADIIMCRDNTELKKALEAIRPTIAKKTKTKKKK